MARKPKGRSVTGWLCLDKAAGRTSTDAVASVKRLFGAAKVGHAGTLDPLATGALPIALGDATKTVPYVQDARKVYRFTVRWGAETDTDDAEGKVTVTSDERPERAAIEALLPAFTGEIMQQPPAYSALKVDGERAYDLARSGTAVVLDERPVTIHRLALTDVPDRDHAVLEAETGKGAYVRALARDLGRRLGCLGHVVELRRLAVGPFDQSRMIALDTLIAAREEGDAASLTVSSCRSGWRCRRSPRSPSVPPMPPASAAASRSSCAAAMRLRRRPSPTPPTPAAPSPSARLPRASFTPSVFGR